MQAKHNDYPIALSIDLRVFDNQQPDYGVRKFLDTLGFVPEYLFNHETYVGHIHSNDGVIDDTPLLPTWTAQRAVPGCQVWSRKQYYELIKVLHTYDIKFFQGAEAASVCGRNMGLCPVTLGFITICWSFLSPIATALQPKRKWG